MEQIDLNHLRLFLNVVESKSFSAAANLLSVPKSTISRSVSSLEQSLGVQLLYRTTRKIEMTAPGKALYASCQRELASVEQTISDFKTQSEDIAGIIRVTAVEDMGVELLTPIVAGFGQKFPKAQVNLIFGSSVLDLIGESIDVALRVGNVTQLSYRARKVGQVAFVLVTSQHYLSKFDGRITLDNLCEVDFIAFSGFKVGKLGLRLKNGSKTRKIKVRPKYEATSTAAILKLVEQGGVALLPDFLVEAAIQKGELTTICRGWSTPYRAISIVTPLHRKKSRVVEAFTEFVFDHLRSRL